MKAVIPAAGLGTRMRPATLAVDKELLTVVDRPVIDYVAAEAALAGIEELVLISRSVHPPVLEYLEARADAWPGLKRFSVLVQERPLGLGDAVLQSRKIVGDAPFGVMLPDVLLHPPEQGMAALKQAYAGMGLILVNPVPYAQVSAYGVADCAEEHAPVMPVRQLVEKPLADEAPSNLALTGRYLFTPELFDCLAGLRPGHGSEVQLTDAMAGLALGAVRFTGRCYDCGSREGLAQAVLEYALRDSELRPGLRSLLRDY